jgi:hypothetical protein
VPVGHDSTCHEERRHTVWPYYVCVPRLAVCQSACLKLKNAELILIVPYTPFEVTPDMKNETRYSNNKVADEGTCLLVIRGWQ